MAGAPIFSSRRLSSLSQNSTLQKAEPGPDADLEEFVGVAYSQLLLLRAPLLKHPRLSREPSRLLRCSLLLWNCNPVHLYGHQSLQEHASKWNPSYCIAPRNPNAGTGMPNSIRQGEAGPFIHCVSATTSAEGPSRNLSCIPCRHRVGTV